MLLAEIMVWCGLGPVSVVRHPSVRQVDYLWNYCTYLVLNLCVAFSSQYAHIIFSSPTWLCQQSSWNQNLSVVRPSVRHPYGCGIDYLWTCPMDFFQILFFGCPGPYARMIYNKFLKFTIVSYGKTQNLNYLENEQPQSETEWNLGWVFSVYRVHLIVKCS